MKLLFATDQRVENVLQPSWSEYDLKEGLWAIPAERRKNRFEAMEPHIIPLAEFHLHLLEQVRVTTDTPEWLFSHKDWKQLRKADVLYQATHRFCKTNGIEPFAPRDYRRTFKSLAGSIGIDLELRNRLQGQAMTDVDSVHYDPWSYLSEKKVKISKNGLSGCFSK